jgi:regulator of protease activity HflC (stomatin/prohibitin superfamily)
MPRRIEEDGDRKILRGTMISQREMANRYVEPEIRVIKGIVWAVGIIAVVIILLFLMFGGLIYTIPAGHVGVYDLFGNVRDAEIPTGLHIKIPFAHIEKMSVKTQEYTMSIVAEEGAVKGRSDTISALTKEGLTVDLDITIWFKLQSDKASDIYKTVGTNYREVLVRPKIRESIRSIVARYEAKTIYSEDRERVQLEIQEAISSDLETRGIIIEKVLLRNVQLPEKVRGAIENKLEAEQDAQRMEFILQKEQQEAERKRVEARGIADANQIIADSLTDQYLQWYWIENLDKHSSVIYVPVGEDGMPMFKQIE